MLEMRDVECILELALTLLKAAKTDVALAITADCARDLIPALASLLFPILQVIEDGKSWDCGSKKPSFPRAAAPSAALAEIVLEQIEELKQASLLALSRFPEGEWQGKEVEATDAGSLQKRVCALFGSLSSSKDSGILACTRGALQQAASDKESAKDAVGSSASSRKVPVSSSFYHSSAEVASPKAVMDLCSGTFSHSSSLSHFEALSVLGTLLSREGGDASGEESRELKLGALELVREMAPHAPLLFVRLLPLLSYRLAGPWSEGAPRAAQTRLFA